MGARTMLVINGSIERAAAKLAFAAA